MLVKGRKISARRQAQLGVGFVLGLLSIVRDVPLRNKGVIANRDRVSIANMNRNIFYIIGVIVVIVIVLKLLGLF